MTLQPTMESRHEALHAQVLRQSAGRDAVLFLASGMLWVADFIDGRGELIDAATWVRLNCASASSVHARRRMALEAALPLTSELRARVESLWRAHARNASGE